MAPAFRQYEGGLYGLKLGNDDSLLFAKILPEQVKAEVEKLKAFAAHSQEAR